MMEALIIFGLFIFVVEVLPSTHATHWLLSLEDKCQFTLNTELMISFSEHPSLFVNNFKKKDISECRASCCSHDTCNGYVWDELEGTDNCKLLRCSKKGNDCKEALTPSKGVTIGEVGFITGLNENVPVSVISTTATTTTTVVPHTTKKNNLLNSLSFSWLNQKMQVNKGKISNNVEMKNRIPLKNNSTSQVTKVKLDEVQNKTFNAKHETTISTPAQQVEESIATSVVAVLTATDNEHEHTNTVSLTIALLFGMGFSVTVLYMLGRRWIEGIKDQNKRGYTRISYLLNGV